MEFPPVTYTLRAGEHTLAAWSLSELAELVECAVYAGDRIDGLRAGEPTRRRPRFELRRFVALLADRRRLVANS